MVTTFSFTALSKLEPTLSGADQLDLVKTCLDAVLPLPAGGVGPKKKEEK